MKTHAAKTPKEYAPPVRQESKTATTRAFKQDGNDNAGFQFTDNRPKAKQALQLQALAQQHANRTLQRFGMIANEEKTSQGKLETAQLAKKEDEKKLLQGKFEPTQLAKQEDEKPLQEKVEVIQQKASDTGLPDNLKSGIENLSGMSMDDVKVHYNSSRPAQLQAHAYTQGANIHVAPGQEKHLPHEAWHVVQQKQGRVKPTLQMKGSVNVNDDKGLEKEADVMGAKALTTTVQRQNKAKGQGSLRNENSKQKKLVQARFSRTSQIVQRTKHGNKIDFTFHKPNALITPVFSDSNRVFGAARFYYDVTFRVDEQGTKNTEDYRIGEFRQYYKGGLRVFGKKFDWEDDWVEDTLNGNDHYGYRSANTHASKYIVNDNEGDKLEMYDKPELQGVSKPDEIAYDQEFKGEVVAVDRPGGEVQEVLETQFWRVKGVGTRDKDDNIYYGVYHGQVMHDKIKSKNKSKRKRKEASGKYEKPTPDG